MRGIGRYWEVWKNGRVRGFLQLVIPCNTCQYCTIPSITRYYQVFGIFVSVPAPLYKWIYWTLPGVHQCALMYTDVNQFKWMYTHVELCTAVYTDEIPCEPRCATWPKWLHDHVELCQHHDKPVNSTCVHTGLHACHPRRTTHNHTHFHVTITQCHFGGRAGIWRARVGVDL